MGPTNLHDPSPSLDERSERLADSSHSVRVQIDRVPRPTPHPTRVVDHLKHIDMASE